MKNLIPSKQTPDKSKIAIKQISFSSLLRSFFLLIFVSVFLFSLFKIIVKLYAYHKEDMVYEDMRASVQSSYELPTRESMGTVAWEEVEHSQGETKNITLPFTVFKGDPSELNSDGIFNVYSALKEQNDDLVGWLSMPGFQKVIDYPVMQSFDNEFYMTHDFYKNKSNSGSLFMDAANMNSEPDRNIIIYGHAMRNNSMFGNLRGYPEDEEKYNKNTTIYLDLLNMCLEYQVFSAYSIEASFDYRRTTFVDDADFLSFLDTIKGKSKHDFGLSLSSQDKIITLSTCDKNYGKDGRIAIHAKLVKQIIYDDSAVEGTYVKGDEISDKKVITSNVYLETLLLQYNDSSQAVIDSSEPNEENEENVKNEVEADSTIQWKHAVFDPPFSTANAIFSTNIPEYATLAKLSVKTYDSKARFSCMVNGESIDPERFELSEGDNVIAVRVVSSDSLYARTYTINVIKESSSYAPDTSSQDLNPMK